MDVPKINKNKQTKTTSCKLGKNTEHMVTKLSLSRETYGATGNAVNFGANVHLNNK